MNIDWFKDLQAIEQKGSFSKASGLRNISQPALTKRIKALEEWAEQPLVDRNKRPVSLTSAGHALCSTCAEFFETLEHQRLDLLNRTAVNKQTVIRFAASIQLPGTSFLTGCAKSNCNLARFRPACGLRI